MLSKIKNYSIGVLIMALIGFFLFTKRIIKNKENQILELKNEKEKELKIIKDSAYNAIDNIIFNSLKKSKEKYDSLLLTKIKYVPYEKPIYTDRNLDDAINILTDYSYKKTIKKDSTINESRKNN